jgi:hypothetical protein
VKPGITLSACSSARASKRVLQRAQRRLGLIDRVAHPEAEIGRDLVVARARGVEPARRRPDRGRPAALGEHVDVLEREIVGHAVGFELGGDLPSPSAIRAASSAETMPCLPSIATCAWIRADPAATFACRRGSRRLSRA